MEKHILRLALRKDVIAGILSTGAACYLVSSTLHFSVAFYNVGLIVQRCFQPSRKPLALLPNSPFFTLDHYGCATLTHTRAHTHGSIQHPRGGP